MPTASMKMAYTPMTIQMVSSLSMGFPCLFVCFYDLTHRRVTL